MPGNNLIDIVANLELNPLQGQLEIADQEYDARKAELAKTEEQEHDAKLQQPVLMNSASEAAGKLREAETTYFPEGIALGSQCDFEGLAASIAKKRATVHFVNGCLTYLVETVLPDLRIKTMTARISETAAEARVSECEALVCAKKISLTLGPVLQESGQLEIVSENLETLVRHTAALHEKHGLLTAELQREVERVAKARALRTSTGGPVTRNQFIQ